MGPLSKLARHQRIGCAVGIEGLRSVSSIPTADRSLKIGALSQNATSSREGENVDAGDACEDKGEHGRVLPCLVGRKRAVKATGPACATNADGASIALRPR